MVSRNSRTNVHQIREISRLAGTLPNFDALRVRDTAVENFCFPKTGPKFSNLRTGVQQGPDYNYQCTRFHHLLITCVRDIYCRTWSISLKAWSTDQQRTVNDMSPPTMRRQQRSVKWQITSPLSWLLIRLTFVIAACLWSSYGIQQTILWYLSIYLSVCLSVCLSIYLSISTKAHINNRKKTC